MTEQWRPGTGDEALLARLGRVSDQVDPAPELTYQSAQAAFTLRSIDAELAELVDDSALNADALAGVRGESDLRLLSYQTADVDIELQVTRQHRGHSILGQLAGTMVREIGVETSAGMRTVPVDELGRFTVDDVPRGPFRLRLTGPAGTPVTTDWTTL
jgi:hypothetical protein